MNFQNLRPKARRQQRELAQDELRRRRYVPMIRAQVERDRDDIRAASEYVKVLPDDAA